MCVLCTHVNTYIKASAENPHGVMEGFDGALGTKTCNVQISENINSIANIHRIKWGKMKYQSVTPCLIRNAPQYNLKSHALLRNDNHHMSAKRKEQEQKARRKIKEQKRTKKLNVYNETIKQLQHPKIMPSAFNPDSQAGLASQAYNAVRTMPAYTIYTYIYTYSLYYVYYYYIYIC